MRTVRREVWGADFGAHGVTHTMRRTRCDAWTLVLCVDRGGWRAVRAVLRVEFKTGALRVCSLADALQNNKPLDPLRDHTWNCKEGYCMRVLCHALHCRASNRPLSRSRGEPVFAPPRHLSLAQHGLVAATLLARDWPTRSAFPLEGRPRPSGTDGVSRSTCTIQPTRATVVFRRKVSLCFLFPEIAVFYCATPAKKAHRIC
jgi:hypothetical protein